jgi:ubiquinone/menaquinone biosynthesis C-methylase UbiE
MSFTLELFVTPEIPSVLKECQRILRAGGRLGVVAMSQSSHPGIGSRLYQWTHTHFPKIVDCKPIPAGETIENSGFRLVSCVKMQMWGLPVEAILAIKDKPVWVTRWSKYLRQ